MAGHAGSARLLMARYRSNSSNDQHMSEDQRIRVIAGLTSLDEIASMRKNLAEREGLTSRIDDALRDRAFTLYQGKVADRLQRRIDTLLPLELKIVRGLAALWLTHEKNVPPNRSLQAIRNRDGDLIAFAEDVVSSGAESSGYHRLKAAAFEDLVFERVVLDHPDVFSERARLNAQRRLQKLEQAPIDTVLDDRKRHLGDGTYSTKDLLGELGFEKPQPTAWYALRGDEIVFLSWVAEADFERGIARILADEGDTRPNFYHWRAQIEKIREGVYRNAYVVFGYKGPGNANVQHSPRVRLYVIRDIRSAGAEVFATFAMVGEATQNGPDWDVESTGNGVASASPVQMTTTPVRPEQPAFRRALLERFNGRCALSGCAVAELLDAAHLPGRDWTLGHNTAADGILLRTDLHRALDNGLIRLDEELRLIWVDPSVSDLYGPLIRPIRNSGA